MLPSFPITILVIMAMGHFLSIPRTKSNLTSLTTPSAGSRGARSPSLRSFSVPIKSRCLARFPPGDGHEGKRETRKPGGAIKKAVFHTRIPSWSKSDVAGTRHRHTFTAVICLSPGCVVNACARSDATRLQCFLDARRAGFSPLLRPRAPGYPDSCFSRSSMMSSAALRAARPTTSEQCSSIPERKASCRSCGS